MKLRIRGNSLRLRLTQSEVKRLADSGQVASTIQFGSLPGDSLAYSIVAAQVDHVYAIFSGGRLEVQVAEERIKAWANSDDVGIDENINNGAEGGLRVLI